MKKKNTKRCFASVVVLIQLAQLVPVAVFARDRDRPGSPIPVPSDTESARREGMSDGNPDGAREGRERGQLEGSRQGREEGLREGYRVCFEQRRREAYDHGYAEGIRLGSNQGNSEGQLRGYDEGQASGRNEGRDDGRRRAAADARRDAAAPGAEQGRRDAEASDAWSRGSAAGTIAGEARARQAAKDVEYPRGREAHRVQRLNEPVSKEVSENLSQSLSVNSAQDQEKNLESLLSLSWGGSASPDYRYSRERRHYPDWSMQQAYSQGYRSGYQAGFQSEYSFVYRQSHELAERIARDDGCRRAQFADVRGEFARGRDDGYRRGYNESFEQAYRIAYRLGYDPAFRQASDDSYRSHYSSFYSVAFEEFRAAAYAKNVDRLYRSGFDQADRSSYERAYPGFAQQEFDRGLRDEMAEFAARPIRLMDLGFREQTEDSIVEPGETISFWFYVRNFADRDLPANELRFEVETSAAGLLPVRQKDVPSVALPTRGAIRVSGAVPVIVSESVLNQPVSAVVKVFWRGNLVGTKAFTFAVRNRATLELIDQPVIREGLETALKVRIKNNSTQAIAGPVRVELRSDGRQIELRESMAELATLASGEAREVTFKVVGRTDQEFAELPLAIAASDGARRRVSVRDFSGSVPVVNDYRVKLTGGNEGLKSSGFARLKYLIRNVSSRLVFGALELKARVLDSAGREVPEARWIGFNPQFLLPLERGEQAKFVIPVVLPQGMTGGVVELEVRENGVPVVIHQARF